MHVNRTIAFTCRQFVQTHLFFRKKSLYVRAFVHVCLHVHVHMCILWYVITHVHSCSVNKTIYKREFKKRKSNPPTHLYAQIPMHLCTEKSVGENFKRMKSHRKHTFECASATILIVSNNFAPDMWKMICNWRFQKNHHLTNTNIKKEFAQSGFNEGF